jgi:general secretion pathway protein C
LVSSLTIRRIFWLLDATLFAGIALLAVQIFNALAAPPPPVSSITTETANSTPDTRQVKSADYYAAMSNSRIFGDAGVVPGTTGRNNNSSSGSLDSLPATALTTLKLLGTTVGTEGMSTAVIEDGPSVNVYRVGDKVAASAVVEQILPKMVILNRDGTREVLTSSLTQKSSATTTPLPPRGPTPRTSPGGDRLPSRPDYTMVERSEWQDKDPYELLGEGKITPAWKDGRVEGLQLENIGSNQYAQQLGLREGDIVRSVNGVQIRSIDEAISLAEKLQKAPVIRVEVMRDGKPQTLTYRLR